jgi:hypothetical protein
MCTISSCWSAVNGFAIFVHFPCSLCRDPYIYLDLVRLASISVVVRYTFLCFATLCEFAFQRSIYDGLSDS